MRTTEQEIIDMENFYQTATPEEAMAYYKKKYAQLLAGIHRVIGQLKKVAAGMCRFFTSPRSISGELRKALTVEKVTQNLIKVEIDIEDKIEMASLLLQAEEILFNRS